MSKSLTEKKERPDDDLPEYDCQTAEREPDSGYFSPLESSFDFNESTTACSSSGVVANQPIHPRASTPKPTAATAAASDDDDDNVLDWDLNRSQVFQRRRSLSDPGLSLSFRLTQEYNVFNAMVETADASTQTDIPNADGKCFKEFSLRVLHCILCV